MEVFRLTRKKYAGQLSGKGAALHGARWNSKGVELIYTAQNRSLAMAEIAVHFSLGTLPDDYVMLTLFIPDKVSLQKITRGDLPKRWNDFPHPQETQDLGDRFVGEYKTCILQIPSVVTRGDFNILINPHHPDFSQIKIVDRSPFPFDRRLFNP